MEMSMNSKIAAKTGEAKPQGTKTSENRNPMPSTFRMVFQKSLRQIRPSKENIWFEAESLLSMK